MNLFAHWLSPGLLRRSLAGACAVSGCLFAGPVVVFSAETEEPAPEQVVVFEGRVERADASLAGAAVRDGIMLSGEFAWVDPSAATEDAQSELNAWERRWNRAAVYADFTLDWNYVLVGTGAMNEPGGDLFISNDDPESDGQDFAGLVLPVDGSVGGDSGWAPRWLELWFYDAAGKMIRQNRFPTEAPAFERAWFRLTFGNAGEGTQAVAEGPLFRVGRKAPVTASGVRAQLENAILDLNEKVDALYAELESLRTERDSLRERIRGLNQTVDLLVTDKAALESEVERLRFLAEDPDPELKARVADLEAELAMREDRAEEFEQQRQQLNEQMREALAREARLERELEAARAAQAPEPKPSPVANTNTTPSDEPPAFPELKPGEMVTIDSSFTPLQRPPQPDVTAGARAEVPASAGPPRPSPATSSVEADIPSWPERFRSPESTEEESRVVELPRRIGSRRR